MESRLIIVTNAYILFRNISLNQQPSEKDIVHSDMQYKICRNTYHMFYVMNTEDAYIRSTALPQIEQVETLETWLNKKHPHNVKLDEKTRSLLEGK